MAVFRRGAGVYFFRERIRGHALDVANVSGILRQSRCVIDACCVDIQWIDAYDFPRASIAMMVFLCLCQSRLCV